jgi:hypothetical protein
MRVLATAALVSAISLLSTRARADQFVAMDERWIHGPDMPDSHYRVSPDAGTPADWSAYADGSAWVYLEVLTKPTAQETKFQVCFEATPTYACTYQSPTYTSLGTYEWETPFSAFWSPPNTSVDWSQGTNKLACILKDTMNGKPSADNVGDQVAALYMPTEVRMVVTIVANGSTYIAPQPTGTGGEGGAGGGMNTGGGATGGGAPSSGGAGGTTSGSGGEMSSGGNAEGGFGGNPVSDEGCAWSRSSKNASSQGAVAIVVALMIAGRRRHRRV